MIQNKLFTIFTFALMLISLNNLFAGDHIKIILQQPPPNLLNTSNLWKLTLENTSKADLTIYLEGSLSESKNGLIVSGQSKPFVIKPGKTSYGYNDFKSGSVKWNNNNYQEAIVRTGNAPSGSYTICVTAKLENGEVTGQESCIEQNIEITSQQQIQLVTPAEDAELDPDTLPGLMFIWRECPMCPPMFTLRIVEIKGEQSPDVAMQNNSVFYEEKGIKGTTYPYPQSAPKFENGKKYAWQIVTTDIKSDIRAFSVLSATHCSSAIDSLYCTSTPGQYRFKLRVCVDYNNTTFPSATIEPFTFTNNCVPSISGVTYAVSGLSPVLPQTITTPGSGTNCMTFTGYITTTPPSVVTSVEMLATLRWGSSGYQVTYQPTGIVNALNNCCVPPPPNMVCWWPFDELTGTTPQDIRGFNNAGSFLGIPVILPIGKVGPALEFATNNNYVVVPNHSEINFGPCESFSIDCWIRTIAPHTNATGMTQTILDKRESGNCASLGYGLYLSWGVLGFQVGSGATFTNYQVVPTAVNKINDGAWHLVAVTYDRTLLILTLYQDGVVQKTVTGLNIPNLINSADLVIGSRHPNFGASAFIGDIDEVEYFKRAITQTEILSIFNAQSSGKCKQ